MGKVVDKALTRARPILSAPCRLCRVRVDPSLRAEPVPTPPVESPSLIVLDRVTWECWKPSVGAQAFQPRSWDLRRLGKRVVTVRTHRAIIQCTLRICASCGSTRLICASFGSTRLICASFGSTRLLCTSFGSTRLICVSFGSTRLICAFYGTTRRLCRVRAQRGADRREAGRMREGHMDASGFLIASADVFC
ncbi:DNA-directed RNA polymerase I subunit RPA1-like [Cucumis melo var. makuwa]|uniref:DNA-directed RNA polymerase I subunit RPA1-like n=1 Tax=Cucumis melo var. makuwa TaxID=1194695 RepID=A0A5A7TY67_CUCMM|nr:DNA-directed RNA polymerase I subunit RPA1-like [Cucumis melo var. makuwa]